MGMLQLAGVVSGFGKGLQQGLQQTQQYMSQSLLLEERDKNERERMKLTFAHDEGMLQKRAAIEATAADKLHSRTLERDEQRQDFEAGENRKTRQADREKADAQAQKQRELEEYRQQNAVTNKVLDASYEQQKDATKSKQDRAKEERDRQAKREEANFKYGADVQLEKIRGENRAHAGGSAKADHYEESSAAKLLEFRIKAKVKELTESFPSEKRAKQLRDEIADLERQQNELHGMSSGKPERKPIIFPE